MDDSLAVSCTQLSPLGGFESLLSKEEPLRELDQKPTFLFFSANWSRPCRTFTPELVEIYNTLKNTENEIRIIFLSLDTDKKRFIEYSKSMPWIVAPFDVPKARGLCENFRVSRIPALVSLNSDGNSMKEDVVGLIDDYGIDAFPFNVERRKQLEAMDKTLQHGGPLGALLGSRERDFVVNGDGVKIPISELAGKTIALYFGGHWSAPCRSFAQQLAEVSDELSISDAGKFQVIFVSTDASEDEFERSTKSLPWPYIPFKDKSLKSLSRIYAIDQIPALILIGADGRTLTTDGRTLIAGYGARAFPFTESKIRDTDNSVKKEGEGLVRRVRDPKHRHELKLERAWTYVCDGCGGRGRFWVYSCPGCNFDLHPQCVQADGNASANFVP